MTAKITLLTASLCLALTACSNNEPEQVSTQKNTVKDINFLAFGDGGYHVDYPKTKHIKNPRTKEQNGKTTAP